MKRMLWGWVTAGVVAITSVSAHAEGTWTLDQDFRALPGFAFVTGPLNAVLPDGSAILGDGVTKLQPDGRRDTTYPAAGAPLGDVFASPYGMVVAKYDDKVVFVDATGTAISPEVTLNSDLRTVLFQSDGKAILVGWFSSVNGVFRPGVARMHPNGTLDTSFDPGSGPDVSLTSALSSGYLQSDGRILLCGRFHAWGGIAREGTVRLNADGTIDLTYDPGVAIATDVSHVAVDSAGRIWRAGGGVIHRSDSTGAGGTAMTSWESGAVTALVPLSDGRILVAGGFESIGNAPRRHIARLHDDGSVDLTFDAGVRLNDNANRVHVMSDGRIVLNVGSDSILRLLPDGDVDPGFQPETPGLAYLTAVAPAGTGKVVIGGLFTHVDGTPRPTLARLLADGSLDPTFDPAFGVGSRPVALGERPAPVRSLAVQTDGAVIVGGAFDSAGGLPHTGLARFAADGSIDQTFAVTLNDGAEVNAVVLQSDGRIVIGGAFTTVNGVARANLARLLTDGSIDPSFVITSGVTGAAAVVHSVSVLPDDSIIVAGHFDAWNATRRWSIAKLGTDGAVDLTFDPGSGTSGLTIRSASALNDGSVAFGAVNAVGNIWTVGSLSATGGLGFTMQPPTGLQYLDAPLVQADSLGGFMTGIQRPPMAVTLLDHATIERMHPGGSFDRAFLPEFMSGEIHAMAREPDGAIVAAGGFTGVDGLPFASVVRFLPPQGEPGPRLANISTRARVGPGEEALIAGFVVEGTDPQRVLVRGVGPTLALDFGVSDALDAFGFAIYRANETTPLSGGISYQVSSIAYFGTERYFRDVAHRFGAFPLSERDPRYETNDRARVLELEPGAYTVKMSANTPGVGLVEVYDINGVGANRRIVNLSTRGRVGAGGDVMIAGFVVDQGAGRMLVRGIGPELATFDVAGFLGDPIVRVYRSSDGFEIASSDNWSAEGDPSAIADAAAAVGAFPLPSGSLDAALLLDLEPGAYTAVVAGVGDATGVALVEAYRVP